MHTEIEKMTKRPKRQNFYLSFFMTGLIILLVGMAVGVELVQRKTGLKIAAIASSVPKGARYNLDLFGVPKGKSPKMTTSENQRIFLPLTSPCKIEMDEGVYTVTKNNCTDGIVSLQMPNPANSQSDGITTYAVWVKALGRPGGASKATKCVDDPITKELYCSLYTLLQIKNKGQNLMTDITTQLLFIYADTIGKGQIKRISLFDDKLKDFYWRYDTDGLKLAQLRFYEIPPSVK